MSPSRPVRAAAPAALAALIFLLATVLVGGDPVDDAAITFRYARNLAAGHGLCFNPGERVEGYVHFLWIVLLAATERLTGLEPMRAGPELGRLFGALAVVWTALVAGQLRKRRSAPWLAAAPFLLATNLYFVLWCVAGLETPLFTWLVLVALHLRGRGGRSAIVGAPLALVLACMTRPEGVLVAAGLALDALLARPRLDRRAVAAALWFLLPGGLYFLWRWHYFGHFLPNVYYAKADAPVRAGLYYVWLFLIREEPRILLPLAARIALLACTLAPALLAWRILTAPPLRAITITAALWLGGVVFEGGDGMGGFRFLVPAVPLFALAAAAAADHWRQTGAAAGRLLAGALLAAPLAFNAVNGALYAAQPTTSPHRTWFHQQSYYDDMARWVQEHVRPGSLLALGDMGYVPYATPEMRYIDFLGLVDPVIAHLEGGITNPEVYRYLWERRPAYFLSLVHRRPNGRLKGHTPVDIAMLRFLRPDVPEAERLFARIAEIPGWIENNGDVVSFYVYRRIR
ncbi:MAG: hypothetical protein JXQ29_05135 [Planctomycetes bacterium]|nr:hypothetical protein [Planctomycetota bacterium]